MHLHQRRPLSLQCTPDADITPDGSPANVTALCEALIALGPQLRVPGLDHGVPVQLSPAWFSSMTTMTFERATDRPKDRHALPYLDELRHQLAAEVQP